MKHTHLHTQTISFYHLNAVQTVTNETYNLMNNVLSPVYIIHGVCITADKLILTMVIIIMMITIIILVIMMYFSSYQ